MRPTNKLLLSSRIIVGITFIFSGFVKAVDPMGTVIKVTDYFIAFNMQGLEPVAVVVAFILCCYELPLGVAVLLGARGKLMSKLLLLIMSPFLIITLYLAIKNPVTDCGCFGDALILTNWQTFYKNVILMILTLIIFSKRKEIVFLFKEKWEWMTVILSLVFILVISIYSYSYLPIMDFRPYKVGNNIQEKMVIPEGKTGDVYETILIYKDNKTGETKEFDADNIPMDENLEFVEVFNKLKKKGYTPPIQGFKISDSNEVDVSDKFLSQGGYRLVIIHHKLKEGNENVQEKLNQLVNKITAEGNIQVWAITSSLKEDIDQYTKLNHVPYSLYSSDIIMLETMIRSNPGLLLFKDNVVIKKWSFRRIPSYEKLGEYLYQ
ncbi:BT_3928 family protein [Bacteroidota bacterium]